MSLKHDLAPVHPKSITAGGILPCGAVVVNTETLAKA